MFRRIVALIVCIAFISSNLQYCHAQAFNIRQLPAPGTMVEPALNYVPLTLKGLVLHPEDALKFDFLMDTGNTGLKGDALKDEALKVMTYFLTSLTMKEDDMWVNLSPYEQGKVIERTFGNTVMGRDLLAEDYVLKQLTASLIYPEKELGQTFWKEVYTKIDPSRLDDLSIDSINKVWIVPSEAVVWEHDGKVMIVKSHLRVMLDEDFKAIKEGAIAAPDYSKQSETSRIVREVILPVLEKQVNEGEHFVQLRQMYQAMILATWYKKALKESIIARVYADKGKIAGVENNNSADIEAIYQKYLEAFKKGAFNYIKEDVDAKTGEVIPRKYFSGGFTLKMGIVSLATALSVWSGMPTPAQATEIAQATNPVGTTVLVTGSAAEADKKGQPILVAQGDKTQNISSSLNSEHFNKFDKWYMKHYDWEKDVLEVLFYSLLIFGLVPIAKALAPVAKAVVWIIGGMSYETYHIIRIRRLARQKNVQSLITYLNDENKSFREETIKALSEWITDSVEQYKIGFEQIDNKYEDVRIWAIGMLARSGKVEGIGVIKEQLNRKENDVRESARKALDQLVTDLEERYLLGFDQMNNPFSDVKIWAISLLVKSKDRRAIEPLAEILGKLDINGEYELYNVASDALYAFGDIRSEYRYQYYPEEGHMTDYDGVYQYTNTWYVVDKEAYWEKVRRSDATKTEVLVAPFEEKWMPVYVNASSAIAGRVRNALDQGRLGATSIVDNRLLNFLKLLESNGLNDIVIVGGAVRDAIAGGEVKDFDITVKAPLSADEKGALRPLSRETYEKSEAILARLANALGVTAQQIKDEANPVEFEGVPIQYLGPAISKGPQALVFNTLIVDKNTGEVHAGFTGPEILFMGMDANGRLFGYKEALDNWLKGRIALKGDLKEGRNMNPLTVLRILRLRHQFGLAISDVGEKLMRKSLEESRKNTVEPQLLVPEIAAVIDNAIDQQKAREELKDWGFEAPTAQAFSKTNRLVGIGAMATVLSLGSAVPTDVQASVLVDLHQYISGPTAFLAFIGFFFGAVYGSYKWITRTERSTQRAISKYFQENRLDLIFDLLEDNDSRVRAAARESLSNLRLDSETQYQLWVEQIEKRDLEYKIWALRMLIKFNNKNFVEIAEQLLNDLDDRVSSEAMKTLSEYVNDSKVLYRLGIQELISKHYEKRIWAIEMLKRSKDPRAVEALAAILEEPLYSESGYILYNKASDALFVLGDPRSGYKYENHPIERHKPFSYESHDNVYDPRDVVLEDNWEKVRRPDAITTDVSSIQRPDEVGGIALDSRLMDLQIRRDGNGVPLPISQQPLDEINIQGFVPQILDIKTINLIEFLGLNQTNDSALAKI